MRAILAYRHDLTSGMRQEWLESPVMCGCAQAHELRVTLLDGGAPADLQGWTAQAYAVLSNRMTVYQSGSISGNTVSVIWPAGFAALPGAASLVLRLTRSGSKIDALLLRYAIRAGETDAVYDPDDVIPSMSELLAQIAAMEAGTQAAQSAAMSAAQAASAATNAASAATQAADAISGLTVSVTMLPSGDLPAAAVTNMPGGKHIALSVPKGDTGAPNIIKGPAYASLTALQAAVTAPAEGDQYNVGAAPPYHIYRWTGAEWEDQGAIGTSVDSITNAEIDAILAS